MPAMTKPTSPADSDSRVARLRREHADLLAQCTAAVDISRIWSFGFSAPSTTRTSITTPT